MIHEYALDPSVLLSWASNERDYAEFLAEYGLGTTRIVSSFPKRKASKLRSYLLQCTPKNSQSLQAQRYTEMVAKLLETIVLRDAPENQSDNWSEAVKVENERAPFGIVLSSTPIDTARNITPSNMYTPHGIWYHPDQTSIPRTNLGFMTSISNLIRLATQRIVIIDPYGWKPEAIYFIQFLINSLPNNRLVSCTPSITLFYKEKRGSNSGYGSPPAKSVKERILQNVDATIADVDLRIFELCEVSGNDIFHNRCILTEHGGVMTGHGIGVSDNEAHSDEALLMNAEIYRKKWQQFIDARCFEVESQA